MQMFKKQYEYSLKKAKVTIVHCCFDLSSVLRNRILKKRVAK
jgi:hypothetical protein